ncbi:MAG: helix-turn-helix domain-containing protein [Candidatus Buchananbacteria bacterium]
MELSQELAKFGLDGRKGLVYLAILELGQATVHQIALKSGIKRTTCYDIIDQLLLDGLSRQVSSGKRTVITAENPENLKLAYRRKLELVDQLLPELKAFYNLSQTKPKISVFEGREQILLLYRDSLTDNPDKRLYTLTAATELVQSLGPDHEKYIADRVKLGIKVKGIAPDSPEARIYAERGKNELRDVKICPADKYPFGVEIMLYSQKVAIMSIKETELVGILIESQEIHKTLKSIFNLCWDLLPQYLPAETAISNSQLLTPANPPNVS